jgi:deoxyribonuclease-1-like protein
MSASRPAGEHTGQWGVFDLLSEFGLTMEQALKVSDHLPVWAEFSAYEAGVGPVARAEGTAANN